MTITTNDLKKFMTAAGKIRTGSIIPVQKFILFDNGKITKLNEHQFVTLETAFEGFLLVDQHVLLSFLKSTSAEEVTLKQKGKTVIISDGVRELKSPTASPADFSRPPTPDPVVFPFPEAVIEAIGACASFITVDAMPVRCHVYVGAKCVAGSDGEIGYCQEFADDLPEVLFSKSEAKIIGDLKECLFSASSHWHFFQDGALLFGHVKSEASWVAVHSLFKAGRDFEIPAAPLVGFLHLIMSASVGTLIVGTLTGSGGVLQCRAEDRDFNIDATQDIPYEGADFPQFGFGPSRLQRLVRAVPADSYVFARGQGIYYLKSGNTTTLIMEMK